MIKICIILGIAIAIVYILYKVYQKLLRIYIIKTFKETQENSDLALQKFLKEKDKK